MKKDHYFPQRYNHLFEHTAVATLAALAQRNIEPVAAAGLAREYAEALVTELNRVDKAAADAANAESTRKLEEVCAKFTLGTRVRLIGAKAFGRVAKVEYGGNLHHPDEICVSAWCENYDQDGRFRGGSGMTLPYDRWEVIPEEPED